MPSNRFVRRGRSGARETRLVSYPEPVADRIRLQGSRAIADHPSLSIFRVRKSGRATEKLEVLEPPVRFCKSLRHCYEARSWRLGDPYSGVFAGSRPLGARSEPRVKRLPSGGSLA